MKTAALVDGLLTLLPQQAPTASAALCLGQLEIASIEDSHILLDVVVSPPRWISSGEISREPLARWPVSLRESLVRRARALPFGREKIEAFCCLAPWISLSEQRQALDGILDGTSPKHFWGPLAMSGNDSLREDLLRVAPDDWKEEWIALQENKRAEQEALDRRDLDHWPEPEARHLFAWIEREREQGQNISLALAVSIAHLPADLRAEALRWVREWPENSRSFVLEKCLEDLTEEEYRQLVWCPPTDDFTPWYRLSSVHEHLARAPYAARRAWLDTVRKAGSDERSLVVLVPVLEGDDRADVLNYLVEQARSGQSWWMTSEVVPWLSAETVRELALRAVEHTDKEDAHLIASFLEAIAAQPTAVQDACFEPLWARAHQLPPSTLIAWFGRASRWVAQRTEGVFARLLAQGLREHPERLPLPHPRTPA